MRIRDIAQKSRVFIGTNDFLICQHPEKQGHQTINELFMYVVQKIEVEKENNTSIDILTKETINFYKEF